MQKKEVTVKKLQDENKRLVSLSQTCNEAMNRGKNFHEVQERQKKRKVADLKAAAEKVLRPVVKSHWLDLSQVVLCSQVDQVPVVVDYGCSSSDVNFSTDEAEKIDEKEKIDRTLYLSEKYSVSDKCYHEYTQTHPELPKSYKLKVKRKDLSDSVLTLPLPNCGAYRPLQEYIGSMLSFKVGRSIVLLITYNNNCYYSWPT